MHILVAIVVLILAGIFFTDATVTLVRRAIRGERVFEAHRSHAYQWLSRRWSSHLRVTAGAILLNLVWLLPCASFAALYPQWAGWITVVALTPLIALSLAAGEVPEDFESSRVKSVWLRSDCSAKLDPDARGSCSDR